MDQERQQTIRRLCEAIEKTAGRKMQVRSDFDFLSRQIFDSMHQQISPTTLKRLWGYLAGDVQPRKMTLDILARYAGYDDWDTFAANNSQQPTQPAQPTPPTPPPSSWRRRLWLPLLAAVAVAAVLLLGRRGSPLAGAPGRDSALVIRLGQTFATERDYMKLFGVYAEDTLWGQRLPHHPYLSLWGPQYHHPNWHNDGDSARLLPTIMERWESPNGDADSVAVRIRNNDRFIAYRDLNELRLTFMRGLAGGDSLMFIGVYRLDLVHSDYHHLTWQRVADQVALSHLDYLEELRN